MVFSRPFLLQCPILSELSLKQKAGGVILNNNWNWDSQRAVSAVEQFVVKHDRLPVAKEMTRGNGLPSRRTFEMKVGVSFFEYGKRYHPELGLVCKIDKAVLFHQNGDRSKVNEGKKRIVPLVISGCYPTKPLQLLEEAFH